MASCSIAKADIWEVIKANFGFVGVLVLVPAVCTYMPWLSLVLIDAFYGS